MYGNVADGVGSVSVLLLSQLGYAVTAVSGRPETQDFLTGLGAKAFISREEMSRPAHPLESQNWAGAVDVVGGNTLARVLAEMQYGGTVAACGLAGGFELNTTVMPFILRNVSLRGSGFSELPSRTAAACMGTPCCCHATECLCRIGLRDCLGRSAASRQRHFGRAHSGAAIGEFEPVMQRRHTMTPVQLTFAPPALACRDALSAVVQTGDSL
ncbi:MAG: zinc-binding dehydrogenase [Candidatus Thiothrix putei]|uniref:Zinc-binding dehydrogenase n=1 Tax=Candidatus Thiothrix putei TaxID=3080811 RepID=A0AA95HDJ5_9GAMM|nr:MAG: zinc-binding dehydrogenase [Candidatus Thiothrix putei]